MIALKKLFNKSSLKRGEVEKTISAFISRINLEADFSDYYNDDYDRDEAQDNKERLINCVMSGCTEEEFIDAVLSPLGGDEFFLDIVKEAINYTEKPIQLGRWTIVEAHLIDDIVWDISLKLDCIYEGHPIVTKVNGKDKNGLFLNLISENNFGETTMDETDFSSLEILGVSSNGLSKLDNGYTYEAVELMCNTKIAKQLKQAFLDMVLNKEIYYILTDRDLDRNFIHRGENYWCKDLRFI